MICHHFPINIWREFYQFCFSKKKHSCFIPRSFSAKFLNVFALCTEIKTVYTFFCATLTKFSFGHLKSSSHNHICPIMSRSSDNFRCSFKNNFRKSFLPTKSLFLFFLNVSLDTANPLLMKIPKNFETISNKFRWTSEKKITKRFFEKNCLIFCIWTIRTFLWQSWQMVPAKRPNYFPLRPENIIFFRQSYSEKFLGKSKKQFQQPCHIRFTRMSGKQPLKIWKMWVIYNAALLILTKNCLQMFERSYF